MKKLISAIALAATATTASALPSKSFAANPHAMYYSQGYKIGYHNGKQQAYDNMGRAVAIVGTAVVVGLVIYELGKESRWTANEKGVVYKF